jgi:Flp pilus assembly secretin CpaC
MRRVLPAALTSILFVGLSQADDPARAPNPPRPTDYRLVPQLEGDVQYLPDASLTHPAPLPAAGPATPDASKVRHLREAARHLEAAGYSEQSQKLQQTADEIVESASKLLKEKRAALDQLQGEIAELEESIGIQPQIMLRCRIIEFDRAALKQMGFEKFPSHPIAGVHAPHGLEELVQTLLREKAARILAEPNIVTTNNRPATLRCGGEIPLILPAGGDTTTIRFRETGLSIEAVPVCLPDDRLRLDLAVEIAEPDYGHAAVRVDGNLVPAMNTRRVNTQIEMGFGETKVLGGMFSRRDTRAAGTGDGTTESENGDHQETELIVIVSAESVRGESLASPASDQPAAVPIPR